MLNCDPRILMGVKKPTNGSLKQARQCASHFVGFTKMPAPRRDLQLCVSLFKENGCKTHEEHFETTVFIQTKNSICF